jgi:glyoxylase-like metal-dependent hydrolase (beta-lactamase superfamily II)/rhodanese-related sulfurtransferase
MFDWLVVSFPATLGHMEPPEIDPSDFEREIRATAPVCVLDVRSTEEFDAWHLETDTVPLHQRHWQEVVDDPAAAAALCGPGEALRVICARGVSSQRAVRALVAHGIDAMSVRGGMVGWSRLLRHDPIPDIPGVRVEQFRREARGCLSYMVSSDGEAVVVDPAPDIQPYLTFAREHQLEITRVLDTHVHADHLSGLRDLQLATGATVHVSRGAIARGFARDGVSAVDDGTRLAVGSADLQVLALPGHTSDNIGILIAGHALIAGDSLFADSVARPDLEVGDAGARDAAGQLHRTIHERILPLGPDVRLLPCHYPGGRIDAPIAPRLADVRDAVGLLALSEAAFVDQSMAAMPPRPENYLEIIAANLAPTRADDADGLEIGANNCAATAAAPTTPDDSSAS